MIRIQQLKLPAGHDTQALYGRAQKILRLERDQIEEIHIVRQSIDARKKPDIFLSYTVDVKVKGIRETACLKRCRSRNVYLTEDKPYRFCVSGSGKLACPPVVIGSGPAGLFSGYLLAAHGYRPIVLERGRDVDARTGDVRAFWETGRLDTESNVSFGEGGAGTFSDGKLNTLIKDRDGRGRFVLQTFVEHGAQPEILYEAKPHIGTDVLVKVIRNMRRQILAWGGQVRFQSRVDGLAVRDGRVQGVYLADGSLLETSVAVLATGHSARDTFSWLEQAGIPMEAKAFAVGLRVEHPQSLINRDLYGDPDPAELGPAPYKVTARTKSGRGVYSFCMCPGGYVVNASTQPGRLAINGMSYSARDGANANSAIIVSVTPEDYGGSGPLAGVAFQQRLEEQAWTLANGRVPVQRYGSFSQRASGGLIPDSFSPCIKGSWAWADTASLLPSDLKEAFEEGMEQFGRILPGFDDANALVSGIESRTSSPVRICRDETLQSCVRGLYPCGEGAGYAGGITSAAMDGMRVAEAIAALYAPFDTERTADGALCAGLSDRKRKG